MFVSASQSVTATDENTFYCVGFFQKTVLGGIYEGLMASFDGGKVIQALSFSNFSTRKKKKIFFSIDN